MVAFEILSKDKPDKVLPSLFRILHSNMSVIAPTGNDFEKDYRIWIDAVSHGLKQDARKIILIYDDAEIIGYFQYYVNSSTFMMEKIQFKKEYQGTGIFRLLYSYLFEIIPQETLYVEAYAHKQNSKSKNILKHLGLRIVGESTNGNSYHFRGDCRKVLKRYDNMKNPVPTWYFKGYYLQYIDGIPFKLKRTFDFSFLSEYGRVFKVFDDQDSGNICFGTEKDGQRYFIKFAGAPTEQYNGDPADAIVRLKATLPVYSALKHKNLIELVEAKDIAGGFMMIFKWVDGDCMGRMYPAQHKKFMVLPVQDKLKVFADILDFFEYIASQNYVAIDFYDGSIMYDFEYGKTTICDIDFYRKQPCTNDMGRMWGSSLFQSPEEYQLGAVIDEITNVYTLGATAFALFGEYNRTRDKWQLSDELFEVATRAVNDDRTKRQRSIRQLREDWASLL